MTTHKWSRHAHDHRHTHDHRDTHERTHKWAKTHTWAKTHKWLKTHTWPKTHRHGMTHKRSTEVKSILLRMCVCLCVCLWMFLPSQERTNRTLAVDARRDSLLLEARQARGKRRGFSPGASRAPQGSDTVSTDYIQFPFPLRCVNSVRSQIGRLRRPSPISRDRTWENVRSQKKNSRKKRGKTSYTSDFTKNEKRGGKQADWILGFLVRSLWRAAAPGLKPLHLPRARIARLWNVNYWHYWLQIL